MAKRKNKQCQQKRDYRDAGEIATVKTNLELRHINPMTPNQKRAFEAYDAGMHVFFHGYAGTGKSFIACYLGLQDVVQEHNYEKLVIVRSAVPSRDMGFLPGNLKEKMRAFEEPYIEIVNDLFNRGDAYEILKNRKVIDFTTTSYLRGMTFNDAVIIVEEAQNMAMSELYTILTRVGSNSRIILNGDFRQTDIAKRDRDQSLFHMTNIIKSMDSFEFVEFEKTDIVRSKFVRDLIIKTAEYEDSLAHKLF
jgi:phosphate starvation-inducible protein PhoH